MHIDNKRNRKARWLGAALAVSGLLATAPAQSGDVDVGVSIGINQPGVYGRIDIGRFPQPQLIVQRPVVIVQQQPAYRPAPVYMHVPPGHRKNWRKHCGDYNACGTPVYFVQERWYQDHVAHGGPHRGDRDGRWDDRRDDHRDDRRGGHGHGHGHKDKDKDKGKGHGRGHD